MRQRKTNSYTTEPKHDVYVRQGYRWVKDYETYVLCEKVVDDKILYRECFNKFELYGADWARDRRRCRW